MTEAAENPLASDKFFTAEVQTESLEVLAGARGYNQWIFDTIQPYLGKRVLEVGCGIGTYTKMFLDSPGVEHVCALETMEDHITLLKERLIPPPGKTLDARCQNFLESTEGLGGYDSFVMLNVLEHIEEDSKALDVLRTLLRPGGNLIILVPSLKFLYSNYDRSINHYRRYEKRELGHLITRCGYRLKRLQYFNLPGILGWWVRFCLLKNENFDPKSVKAFETIVPIVRAVESACPPPKGLSLIAIAETPS